MKTIDIKDKYWKTKYKLNLLIQDQDAESIYWKYLIELQQKLEEKGYLYPSEYKKIDSWKLTTYS